MRNDRLRPIENESPSFGSALREVATSGKDLIESEAKLIKAELQESSQRLSRHMAQATIFGGLLAISVLPFMAFLVVGLAQLMDGRYWLSSLIVAVFCAAIGGPMAYRAYQKIKHEDLAMPRSRGSFERSQTTISNKVEDVRDATQRRTA